VNAFTAITSVHCSCEETLRIVTESLQASGLRVLETFDLQDARGGLAGCPCPHHGTNACDCQMLILMVYGEANPPTTLTLHGNDGQTWLSLVNDPGLQPDRLIQSAVEKALKDIPA
jgi:hypothetical protein